MSQLRQKMIRAMQLREFSPKTQEAYVAAVSGLAKYCNKSPDKIDQEEVENYLLNLRQELKRSASTCNVVISGLKVSELVSLRQEHIDSSRMVIRVDQGKGKKDRYTILSQRLLKELRIYYKAYRPENWLFPAKNLIQHISISSAQRIYYKAKKKAGITKGKGIHTLRHCFASHLLFYVSIFRII